MADEDARKYRNPPAEYRYKPGQSGNPNGRPRGARGLKTDLTAELDARHTIKIANKPVTASRQRLMLRTLTIRAAAGDLKAIGLLLGLTTQVLGAEDRGKSKKSLSANDQALFDQIGEMIGWTSAESDGPPEEPDQDHAGSSDDAAS